MTGQNDESNVKQQAPGRLASRMPAPAILAALLPYGSILIGLYGLDSAWAAIVLYHATALLWLAAWRRDGDHPRAVTDRGVSRRFRFVWKSSSRGAQCGFVACAAC